MLRHAFVISDWTCKRGLSHMSNSKNLKGCITDLKTHTNLKFSPMLEPKFQDNGCFQSEVMSHQIW